MGTAKLKKNTRLKPGVLLLLAVKVRDACL